MNKENERERRVFDPYAEKPKPETVGEILHNDAPRKMQSLGKFVIGVIFFGVIALSLYNFDAVKRVKHFGKLPNGTKIEWLGTIQHITVTEYGALHSNTDSVYVNYRVRFMPNMVGDPPYDVSRRKLFPKNPGQIFFAEMANQRAMVTFVLRDGDWIVTIINPLFKKVFL
jgi:hypothetical protein